MCIRDRRKLAGAHVALFGLGGVGSYAAEALARCGVGELTLTDADVVSPSNLNRQLVALRSTVGRYKTEVMQERIADINPDCKAVSYTHLYSACMRRACTDIIYRTISFLITNRGTSPKSTPSAPAATNFTCVCTGVGSTVPSRADFMRSSR